MNRRTFLKATSASALAVVAIPATAKTDKLPEAKWINFTDEMPKIYQRVALFTYFGEKLFILSFRFFTYRVDYTAFTNARKSSIIRRYSFF